MTNQSLKVRVLQISLYNQLVGYLAGYQDGKAIFTFSHEYISQNIEDRSTLSLKYYKQPDDAFRTRLKSRVKLPPVFSNLLPEGELRDYVVRNLKVHTDAEFDLLARLGRDLPGALSVNEIKSEEIPPYALEGRVHITPEVKDSPETDHFSLSGVLMKFSIFQIGDAFHVSKSKNVGTWIVKVPSSRFLKVPLNEFSSMKLAEAAGITIPEIKLINLEHITGLPDIKMPDEPYAYAIKRFDRDADERIHAEDFAQVFDLYPAEKYRSTNYDTIAKTIFHTFPDPIPDIQEFVARLAVNIMIGNCDAHIKNWSVLYKDGINPSLSPAYDIVFTRAYIESDDSIALNLGKEKKTDQLTLKHFKTLAKKADIDWLIIRARLYETIEKARDTWPSLLNDLAMPEVHKKKLKKYWQSLTPDFKIVAE